MGYELINQELGIYSCSIADLTMEQVERILKTWEEGSKIGGLIVFYDNDGKIVLNKDCSQFEKFKSFIPTYTGHSLDERKEFKEKAKTDTLKMVLDVIDNALLYREKKKKDEEFQSLRKMLGKQNGLPYSGFKTIFDLYNSYKLGNKSLGLLDIYNYGFIQGKRAERARRKAAY